MERKVVGKGSYGCVLSPAIVFYNSKVVTKENAYKYVTKLAYDAEDEYDVAEEILRRTRDPKIGIFPVERLHCGVTLDNLGSKASTVISTCEDIFSNFERKGIRLYKETGFRYSMKGGYGDSLCAIQYEKYFSDLRNYNTFSSKDSFELYDQLKSKLEKLHQNEIVHLDIAARNIALVSDPRKGNIDARFADWGFAQILPKIDKKFINNLASKDVLVRETAKAKILDVLENLPDVLTGLYLTEFKKLYQDLNVLFNKLLEIENDEFNLLKLALEQVNIINDIYQILFDYDNEALLKVFFSLRIKKVNLKRSRSTN